MATSEIDIEVNGVELKAEVHFDYTPAVPAKLYGHPEDCWPEEPAEWEFTELYLMADDGSYTVDISELIAYIDFDQYGLEDTFKD